jgi:hypothetical protein
MMLTDASQAASDAAERVELTGTVLEFRALLEPEIDAV